MIRVEMEWKSEKPDSLSLKECTESRSKGKAELGTLKGKVQQGCTESCQVRFHSEENGPGPPHIPA